MNSSKLKLFLIFIFIAVDLFFLFKLTDLNNSKSFFSDERIDEAVQVLEEKGVKIKRDSILRDKNTPATLKFTFDLSTVEKVASKMMQNKYGSFKIPNGQNFASDTESFSVFYDYSFEYRLLSMDMQSTDTAEILSKAEKADEKQQKEFSRILGKLLDGIEKDDAQISIKVKKYLLKDGLEYIQAVECIGENEIDSSELQAVFSDKKLIFAAGTFFFSEKISKYTSDANNSIDILFSVEKKDAEIVKMEMVYFPVYESTDSVYLAPSYKFSYSDGITELYDATSGLKRK